MIAALEPSVPYKIILRSNRHTTYHTLEYGLNGIWPSFVPWNGVDGLNFIVRFHAVNRHRLDLKSKKSIYHRCVYGDVINYDEKIKFSTSYLHHKAIIYKLPTLPEHTSSSRVLSRVHVTRSFVICVVLCKSLFVLLCFLFWPLGCLPFFDLRIPITHLISSNSSVINYGWLAGLLLKAFYRFVVYCSSIKYKGDNSWNIWELHWDSKYNNFEMLYM